MKVRSATYFFSASSRDDAIAGMRKAAGVLAAAKQELVHAGFEVQTVRVATNSFEDYLAGTAQEVLADLKQLEDAAQGIDFISVGTVDQRLDVIEAALTGHTEKTFFAVPIRLNSAGLPDHAAALRVAEVVCRLGQSAPAKTTEVPAVFRLTVTGNLEAGTPYFPGGFWKKGSAPALALALEDSGILVEALAGKTSLDAAEQALEEAFKAKVVPLEEAGKRAAQAGKVDYLGIDCSVASSSAASESIVVAYESLGLGPFGGAGTLSISAMITAVLKRLPVARCGYSGLMLPVTEDAGLAKRASEGCLSVQQLLFYSAVCGTGIDTVPVEGSTMPSRLAMVYVDMASMAFRLKKPLSARLWPVAGKKAGDMTEVDNPFFVNTKVLTVDPPTKALDHASESLVARAEAVAGLGGGDAVVLSHSPEAVVVQLQEGCAGVAFVLRNGGHAAWPHGTSLRLLHSSAKEGGGSHGAVVEVPALPAQETATIVLAFEGTGCRSGQYRLVAGTGAFEDVDGQPFGPMLIIVG